jgi:hypothetical protein
MILQLTTGYCMLTLLCCLSTGPGYRNVVGLPGGVSSPYFKLLQEANVNGMELREGKGNVYEVRIHEVMIFPPLFVFGVDSIGRPTLAHTTGETAGAQIPHSQ